MKKLIFVFMIAGIIVCPNAFAAGDKTITSQKYVENQVATKQDKIPAVDANTVITHTGTAGEIGEKGIYDSNESYAGQQSALMTAGDANTGINNALENEFICVEEDTDGTCLIWKIKNTLNVLPSDYTQLAYLESTGTQYINTGITPTNSTGVKVKFNRHIVSDQVVVGVLVSGNGGTLAANAGNNGLYLMFGESWDAAICGAAPTNNVDYDISINYMNYRRRYVDGVDTRNITNTLGTSNVMYAFAGNSRRDNSSVPNWFFKGHIYYLKITEGSSIVRDFVPAQRNSDGVLGMYDLASNTFFTNQGSGTFVAGPVLDVYIPSGN